MSGFFSRVFGQKRSANMFLNVNCEIGDEVTYKVEDEFDIITESDYADSIPEFDDYTEKISNAANDINTLHIMNKSVRHTKNDMMFYVDLIYRTWLCNDFKHRIEIFHMCCKSLKLVFKYMNAKMLVANDEKIMKNVVICMTQIHDIVHYHFSHNEFKTTLCRQIAIEIIRNEL